ncbi:hypothetical protein TSMEX_008799, partial [Taenia solium]
QQQQKANATLPVESFQGQLNHTSVPTSGTFSPQHSQSLHGSSRHPLSEYGRFYNLSYASIAEQPSRRLTDMYRRNALHTPATSNSISHLHHFHIPQDHKSNSELMAPPHAERRPVFKRANFLRGFEVHSDRFMLEGGDLSEGYPSRDFIKRYQFYGSSRV